MNASKWMLGLGSILLLSATARSATINWAGAADGDFTNTASWTGGFVPGTGDVANFNVDGAYTVTFNTDWTNLHFTIPKGQVAFRLNAHTYTLTNAAAGPSIGTTAGQTAGLTITGGTLVCRGILMYIGSTSSTGTLNAIGADTVLDTIITANNIQIKQYGDARVSDGALWRNGTGDATRTDLNIGGRLTVANGGILTNGELYVGTTLGGGGGGELWITNGGQVYPKGGNGYFQVGSGYSPARLVVADPGSILNAQMNYCMIGSASTNTEVSVTNGGLFVSSANIWIGYSTDNAKTATVVVAGNGARLVGANAGATLGYSTKQSVGNLTIGSGGVAAVEYVRCYTSNSILTVAAGGILSVTGTVAGAVTIYTNTIIVRGDGVIRGDRVGDSYFRNYGGTVSPGLPLGTLLLSNLVYQTIPAGRLLIELGGTAEGQYDRLVVVTGNFANATLTLGGTCEVVSVNGFQPRIGNSFDILDWSVLATNQFSTVDLPSHSIYSYWVTTNLYTTGQIAVDGPSGTIITGR